MNIDGTGADTAPGDRRNVLISELFTLAPGESRTFDLAILFAQGMDNFDSVAELQAASDAVQARYDAGTLFAPSMLEVPPPGGLATPELLAPEDEAFVVESATLEWTAVPGAETYRLDIATDPDFADGSTRFFAGTTASAPSRPNEVTTYYWRVQATAGLESSFRSPTRSFQIYRYEPDDYGRGTGLIETAYPGADVCPDGNDDPGCAAGYPGNTVWLSANSTSDYVLTNTENSLTNLFRDLYVAVPDDFEIRFTEACATPGACLGVYSSVLPGASDLIVSVPFELWNVGRQAEDVPEDDVRMIPILRPIAGTEVGAEWADTFPAEQAVIAGEDTLTLPVTQRMIGVMPDQPNGYDLFEAAANAFGGAGAIYDPESDGDEQIDINPATGQACLSQGYYSDFCYHGNSTRFVAPLGGLDGVVLADLAGDGTTPPAGTVIRFDSNEPLFVDTEDDAPTQPASARLDAAFPNPFAATATVPFEVERSGPARLSVFDVLGRRVALLVDDDVAAGVHQATFDGRGLATGVYLVVLEADGQRQTKKVMLVR